jgi:branched-chain amino acid transport system permease protein
MLNTLSPKTNRMMVGIAFIVVAAALPTILSSLLSNAAYSVALNMLIKAGYFAIAALGLNIIVGYCGLLNLGFAGFMLIGSYTSGILMKEYNFPFWLAYIAAVAHGAFWGVVLGLPTLRLTGDYFAIVTFGFGELVNMLARNWVSMTRGPRGYPGVPRPTLDFSWLHGVGIATDLPLKWKFTVFGDLKNLYWYLVAVLLGLTIFFCERLWRSRLGRAWAALREDEVAAEACGINAMWYKTIAFAISAGIGALAGAFEVSFSTMADSNNYDFMISVSVLAYLVLGGMGTVRGSVLGAFVLVCLMELLRKSPAVYLSYIFEGWWPGAAQWLKAVPWVPDMRMILYGIILVIMIRFRPEGLLPSRSRSRELHGGDTTDQPGEENTLFQLRA